MSGETAAVLPQVLTLEALEASFAIAVGGPAGAEARSFLTQALEDYAADEAPELGGEDLAALLAQAWVAAEGRSHGEPARITLSPLNGASGRPLGYDALIVIQDDRPFLVDSVMGELAEAGVSVRCMFHPVTEEDGGRESTIIVVLDPLPQERRDALGEAMAQTLADVAGAVDDHAAMAELMGRAIAHLEAGPKGIDQTILAENIAFLQRVRAQLNEFGAVSIGEVSSDDALAQMAEYTEGGDKLHMAYSFNLLTPEFTASHVRKQVEDFKERVKDGWASWSVGNHDAIRVMTRWGGNNPTPALAKLVLAMQLSLKGTPCLYQGD